MTEFVLDASVALAWCFGDEPDTYADAVIGSLENGRARVPSLWLLEMANSLLVAERRRRLASLAEVERLLKSISDLPIEVDRPGRTDSWMREIIHLARGRNLSAYDAAYLHLAAREGLALATNDRALRRAASDLGVELFSPRKRQG